MGGDKCLVGLDLIKSIMAVHEHRLRVDSLGAPTPPRDPERCPPTKKSSGNHAVSIFAFASDPQEEEKNNDDPQDPIELEIGCFINERLSVNDAQDENFDLLKWWCENKSKYPLLSKVAQFILAIPASSAESERVFSASSNTVTVKRTQLLPSNLNGLLVIKSNQHLIY